MVIAPDIEAQILRYYHAEKWRVGTIARQLHVHHSTVRRVLARRKARKRMAGTNQPSGIKRCPARPSGAPRLHVVERPPLRVEQGRAEIEDVARALAHQRERGRTPRAEAPGLVLLEREMGLELLRQHPHPDVVRQANDLDHLDAMVGGGALDAPEQLLADAAAAVFAFNRERCLGVNVAPERRLFAPDRLV